MPNAEGSLIYSHSLYQERETAYIYVAILTVSRLAQLSLSALAMKIEPTVSFIRTMTCMVFCFADNFYEHLHNLAQCAIIGTCFYRLERRLTLTSLIRRVVCHSHDFAH